MTDEFHHDEPTSSPSRRWIWSRWTWLVGLALFVTLDVLLETRLLWLENAVSGQLQQRGYGVEWSEGWLHRLLPARLRFASHFVGDHVLGVHFHSERSGQQPIDDLIPQIKRLPKFCGIVLTAPENSGGFSPGATTSISDATNRLATLKEVGGIESACLCGFTEFTLTEEVIQSLQMLEVEHIRLFIAKRDSVGKTHDGYLKRLKKLRRLKALSFVWSKPSNEFLDDFKNARPDVKVESIPFVKTLK